MKTNKTKNQISPRALAKLLVITTQGREIAFASIAKAVKPELTRLAGLKRANQVNWEEVAYHVVRGLDRHIRKTLRQAKVKDAKPIKATDVW